MKANELRIGNFVTIENKKSWPELSGKPMKVIGIEEIVDRRFPKSRHTVKLGEYSQFEEFISPIPLTPEILERCGFEKHGDIGEDDYWENYWNKIKFGISKCLIPVFDWLQRGLFYYGESFLEIKYLHQLQNLYFALTGEELEIKELQTA